MVVDRRVFPRFNLDFSVSLNLGTTKRTKKYHTECVNISRSSVELSCDESLIKALNVKQNYPQLALLRFTLPNDEVLFCLQVKVLSHRRLSQNHYHLVLIFAEFKDGTAEHLNRYLKSLPVVN